MIETYFKRLSDMSIYQVEMAIDQIIDKGTSFPYVSTIKTIAGSYREMKTREVVTDAIQIEQFSGADCKPVNADQFFKSVGQLFGTP